MEIIWKQSPNFSLGRNGKRIIAIVNHITAGAFNGAVAWLSNPASQASAHYVVSKMGEIVQLVAEENRAWHAGMVKNPNWSLYDGTNPNNYTIGIEHEGYDGTLSELQYQATLWLHKQIITKYGLPADTNHIIGHYRVDSVNRPNCPGPNFPWQRLFTDLTQQSVNIAVGNKIVQGIIVMEGTNARSYAPIRVIAEILGFTYNWQGIDANSGYVIIGQNKVFTVIQNNVGYAKVNDLANAIGKQVAWDAGSNTAIIL